MLSGLDLRGYGFALGDLVSLNPLLRTHLIELSGLLRRLLLDLLLLHCKLAPLCAPR